MILSQRAVSGQGGQAVIANIWLPVIENLQEYGTYHK